jgi:polyhydroxyalkanoate synthesis regulator phasin
MEWMNDDEYCKLTGLHMSVIDEMVESGKLNVRVEDGIRLIDSCVGATEIIVPQKLKELSQRNTQEMMVQPEFIEKTIGTIINLHEKVIDAKDETLEAVKVENSFLREALNSLQELYDEDRKTIATLTEQLKLSQQEVEFMRRKYKLMWNKAIDEHSN